MSTGYPMLIGEEQPSAVYNDETNNATNTIVRKSIPGGASFVELGMYPGTNAPTARFLYVVVNALSDAEETFMLDNPSTRICIPLGEMQRITFPDSDPLTRYAFKTDVAETGNNKVVQRVGSLL